MKVKSIILTILLGILYPFSFIARVHKNRITFISLEHAHLSKDFKILYQRLEKKEIYDLQTLLFKFEPTVLGNLKYVVACVKQLFVIESSRLVIIDYNNFVISRFPHRKAVEVLQIWHATGALKKFGNDVKRDYQIKHYDYAIVNSDFYKKIYAHAFNLPECQTLVTGIPNNDKIFSKSFVSSTRKRLEEKHPEIIGKKVVTYAPTFRGRLATRIREVKIDLKSLHNTLGDNYLILYKAHPLVKNSDYANVSGVLKIEDELISSIFCITDILVTDYSAIAIDWMVFGKPIISFAPDLESYRRKPGFFIDYLNEFPGKIARNQKELVEAVQQAETGFYDEKRKAFCHKVYKHMDGCSTDRVIAVICQIMNHQPVKEGER